MLYDLSDMHLDTIVSYEDPLGCNHRMSVAQLQYIVA
jgi:hypothetical protein